MQMCFSGIVHKIKLYFVKSFQKSLKFETKFKNHEVSSGQVLEIQQSYLQKTDKTGETNQI